MSARTAYRRSSPPGRFSRAWLLDGLRTLGWVLLVTVLIWVYADIHFTEEQEVSATLHIQTQWEGQRVLLETPVEVRVKGNHYAIGRLVQSLGDARSVLAYYPSKPAEAGTRLESTQQILSGMTMFQSAGVQVVSARPQSIEINETLRVLPGVAVAFEHVGAELAEPARVEPERVEVRVPVGQLQKIDPSKLTVSTTTVDLRDAPAGDPVTREVAVLPPPGVPGARVAPVKVRVWFRVFQATDTRKFTVPVRVQTPMGWMTGPTWEEYALVVKDPLEWSKEITVQGNRSDLDRLHPEDIQAFITLTEEDKKHVESWLPGKVQVRFPADLKVTLTEPLPPVNYRMVKRTEPASGTG